MSKFETIVAPVTPCINSPVAIVRVSGPYSYNLAFKICGLSLVPRAATFCSFKNSESKVFDSGIAIFFKSPSSFTGEDIVEFHCHGGLGVLDILIETCLDQNNVINPIRLALPGEFSKRAFLNNKISLLEAEAIANVINSSSIQEVLALKNSVSNDFEFMLNNLSAMLLNCRAELEARIDFVEDNLGDLEVELLMQNVMEIKSIITKCILFAENGNNLKSLGKVVLIGATNVGKSSLLNYLSMKDSAIVSNTEGTTRDVIRETVNIGNQLQIRVSDTAGVRFTSSDVEREGVRRTWREINDANCLLFLCDLSSKSRASELALRDEVVKRIKNKNVRLITIFNKLDKVNKNDVEDILSNIEGSYFAISVKSGEGMDALRSELRNIFSRQDLVDFRECLIVSKRVTLNLSNILNFVIDALKNIEFRKFDLCAEDLKNAQTMVNSIMGKDVSDDLLETIFSKFCIGK